MSLAQLKLDDLPTAEDDKVEFKSSQTSFDALVAKLQAAASGFANAGGGDFVVGVDGRGNADGGIPKHKGRAALRDWVDQQLGKIEPPVPYEVQLIDDADGRGTIQPNNCVLVVRFAESVAAPHQAPDSKYYIRAGAHTVPARHFLIEAIRAKRHFRRPLLRHLFRFKPHDHQILQLGIVAVTDSPALDVRIDLSPRPHFFKQHNVLPTGVPIVDPANPFFIDACVYGEATEVFKPPLQLLVTYRDTNQAEYDYQATIEIERETPSIKIGNGPEEMTRMLERVAKALEKAALRH
jgi:hypothetical protein